MNDLLKLKQSECLGPGQISDCENFKLNSAPFDNSWIKGLCSLSSVLSLYIWNKIQNTLNETIQ